MNVTTGSPYKEHYVRARPSEPQTCAAGLVLGAVSMQQQRKDQDQNEDESHQSHDQQEPPLLIERTLRQGCRKGEDRTGGSEGGTRMRETSNFLLLLFKSMLCL